MNFSLISKFNKTISILLGRISIEFSCADTHESPEILLSAWISTRYRDTRRRTPLSTRPSKPSIQELRSTRSGIANRGVLCRDGRRKRGNSRISHVGPNRADSPFLEETIRPGQFWKRSTGRLPERFGFISGLDEWSETRFACSKAARKTIPFRRNDGRKCSDRGTRLFVASPIARRRKDGVYKRLWASEKKKTQKRVSRPKNFFGAIIYI